MNQQSVSQAFEEYSLKVRVNSMLKTVLVRFLAPALGGSSLKGTRATSPESQAAFKYLSKIPAEKLSEAEKLLEQAMERDQIPMANRRSYRHALKGFLEWAQKNSYFLLKKKEENSPIFNRFHKPKGQAVEYHKHHNNITIPVEPIALCAKKYPKDYVNEELKSEIDLYKKFRFSQGCSKRTVATNLKMFMQIFGWLHRHKNITLDALRFASIIDYVSLSDSGIDNDYNNYLIQKTLIKEVANNKANETVKLVREFLDFISSTHPGTKIKFISSVISLGKFIFKDEVGNDDYIDFFDIPVIKKLNFLNSEISRQNKISPPRIPHTEKSIPWRQAIKTLENLRQRYETITVDTRYRASVSGFRRVKRDESARVSDLQAFLSLGFSILMPPDRARTFYELEISKTLCYGKWDGSRFTPASKINNPQDTQWWIHLDPTQYKTGKTYGDSWTLVPNTKFPDGKTFYQYIEIWLSKGREFENKCDHSFFFRGNKNYKPLTPSNWNSRIKTIFFRETGVPVSPKELRKMYVTWLKDSGATEAELEAAAAAMHHSREMQSRIYDQQTKLNKIAPIQDLNQRFFERFFDSADS